MRLVLTNRRQAFVLERAERLGVPCAWIPKEQWLEGDAVLDALNRQNIDFVVLAGFYSGYPTAFCMFMHTK